MFPKSTVTEGMFRNDHRLKLFYMYNIYIFILLYENFTCFNYKIKKYKQNKYVNSTNDLCNGWFDLPVLSGHISSVLIYSVHVV